MTIIAIAFIAIAVKVESDNVHKQGVTRKDLVNKQLKAVNSAGRNTITNH